MNKTIPWELIIAHFKKDTNQQEETELRCWLEKDNNRSLFIEFSSLWEEIRRESDSYQPDTKYYWKQLETKMNQKKEKSFVSLYKYKITVAAASLLLIISASASFFIGTKQSQPTISAQTYTALNGKSQIVLPDGSTVWINKGSTLTYETSFLTNRNIQLKGEALFKVAKNNEYPFIVNVDDIRVKVTGTKFNVQAYDKSPQVKVALLEGKVSVITDYQEKEMSPGEIASFNKRSKMLSINKDDVAFESFWADSCYTFKAQKLGHICKYLERWYNTDISLDPSIAGNVYTFTITDEPLETILQIMSRISPIKYSFEENNRVIIKHVEP